MPAAEPIIAPPAVGLDAEDPTYRNRPVRWRLRARAFSVPSPVMLFAEADYGGRIQPGAVGALLSSLGLNTNLVAVHEATCMVMAKTTPHPR